jgi:phosphate transport system substrate-binding protein
MRNPRAALLLLSAVLLAAPGCAKKSAPITMKGSDTMVILGQRWAEEYMKTHAGTVIQVTGGGSGTGIAALINGTTDICQSSRPMKDEERSQIQDKYQATPTEHAVAKDGVSIYLHQSNPVRELSVDQIRGIYRGGITNWKEVGGTDAPIVLYGRENNSGTYVFFKEHVLGGEDFAAATQTLPGTAAVVNAVGKDPNGIGYGGAAYGKEIRFALVRSDSAGAAVGPEEAAVKDGSYPLARDLYWYFRGEPEGETRAFLDWVLSPEGQAIVTEVGYFPVR